MCESSRLIAPGWIMKIDHVRKSNWDSEMVGEVILSQMTEWWDKDYNWLTIIVPFRAINLESCEPTVTLGQAVRLNKTNYRF